MRPYANIFTGGGIVFDSDPYDEWIETIVSLFCQLISDL